MPTRKNETLKVLWNFFLNALAVGIATGATVEWNKWWAETRRVTVVETIGVAAVTMLLAFLLLHALFGFTL